MTTHVTYQDVLATSQKLASAAHRTPVLSSSQLNTQLGARVFFKCENLQKVGAFKYRGAYNAIHHLSDGEKARGILAFSSGNHGQAVAKVAQDLGLRACIVMPDNAPQAKVAAIRGYGAELVFFDPFATTREEVARALLQENSYSLIHPFDNPHIIAGQASAAVELLEEQPELDLLLVPTGGGGLLAGSAIATKGMSDKCQVMGVEPALADDAFRSFYSKTLQQAEDPQRTIADGTRTASLGELTFPIILDKVDGMLRVSEEAIKEALEFFFYRMKLVVEPSGALGLAALLSQACEGKGNIGVIISGGNVDASTVSTILAS